MNRTAVCSEFACLYTKHKVQKRKVWKDGKVNVSTLSGRITLFDVPDAAIGHAASTPLDEATLPLEQIKHICNRVVTELETEGYLITIEGPWKADITSSRRAEPSVVVVVSDRQPSLVNTTLNQRNKLLSNKFKVPAKIIPTNQYHNKEGSEQEWSRKRKAPLQPGEWLSIRHNVSKHSNSSIHDDEYHENQHPFDNHHSNETYSLKPQQQQPIHSNVVVVDAQQESQGRCPIINNKNNSRLLIQANDFDPSSYYGYDDEEDEEEGNMDDYTYESTKQNQQQQDDDDNDNDESQLEESNHLNHPLQPYDPPTTHGSHFETTFTRSNNSSHILPMHMTHDHESTSTFSKTDLLQLFGAGRSGSSSSGSSGSSCRSSSRIHENSNVNDKNDFLQQLLKQVPQSPTSENEEDFEEN